eukprot:scaffold8.g1683.t1
MPTPCSKMPKPEGAKPARKRPAEKNNAPAAKKQRPAPGGGGKPKKQGAPPPHPPASRKERKALALARKSKSVKNFGLIQEVVRLWEEARRHDVAPVKRAKLISAILGKVEGRMAELAGSHAAGRVIQTCAKHGTDAERRAILAEVEPRLLELAKSPYGHFVVAKLVALAPKAELPALAKHFKGRIGELLRHPAGMQVVDALWDAADPRLRNTLAAEEYTLFAGQAPAHLGDALAGVSGAQRRGVIQSISRDLIPIMEKGLVDCPLVHRLVAEYMEHAPASLVADAAEYLSGEPLLHMVHTKDGASAACCVLAYGTAKDRKKAVRALKGHVGAAARDEWGHLPLLTALSVVDDTALLRKAVLPELQARRFGPPASMCGARARASRPAASSCCIWALCGACTLHMSHADLAELAQHKYAHRLLLRLLAPGCSRHLPPQLSAIAAPPAKATTAAATTAAAGGAEAEAEAEAGDEKGERQAKRAAAGGGRKSRGGEAAEEEEEEEEEEEGEGEGGGGGARRAGPLGARRRELLGSGAGSLAQALVALCSSRAGELLRGQHGGEVLLEVARGGEGGLLAAAAGADALDAVHAAVAAAAAGAGEEGGEEGGEEEGQERQGQRKAEDPGRRPAAPLTLRRLVLASAEAGPAGAAATQAVALLWRDALQGRCARWVGTHAAKVLAALLHCGSAEVRAAAAAELAPLLPRGAAGVEAWAAQFLSKHGRKEGGKREQGGKKAGGGGGGGKGRQERQDKQTARR